jgi:hypothetical protein
MSFVYVLQDSEVLHLFFVYVLQDSKGLLFMCCRTVRCCIFFVHMLQDGEVLYHLFTCCRTVRCCIICSHVAGQRSLCALQSLLLVCCRTLQLHILAVSLACVLQNVSALQSLLHVCCRTLKLHILAVSLACVLQNISALYVFCLCVAWTEKIGRWCFVTSCACGMQDRECVVQD